MEIAKNELLRFRTEDGAKQLHGGGPPKARPFLSTQHFKSLEKGQSTKTTIICRKAKSKEISAGH